MAIAFQMSAEVLPIGVIMPVLNCRAELPRHMAGANKWLPMVEQVGVVDSFSIDGSLDFLKAELKHPRAEFLSHPPGLYQSWNFAISKITSKYLYVATTGDVIEPATLRSLWETAEHFQADVVLSPPELVTPGGESNQQVEWPIHELIDACKLSEPGVIDSFELFALAAFFATAGGLKGVMGSSASNLYRTDVFQKKPFPTDYRMIGDTVWGLRHILDSRVAICPHKGSKFVVTNGPANDQVRQRNAGFLERLEEEVRQVLRRRDVPAIPNWPSKSATLLEMFEEWKGYSTKRLQLEKYRKAPFPWILRPAAWGLRLKRKDHKSQFKKLSHQILPRDKANLLDFVVK